MGIQQISMEDFHNIKSGRGAPKLSKLTQAVRAMKHGEAIVVEHTGYTHSPTCTLHPTVTRNNTEDTRFSVKHLPDGTVAIACLAIEKNAPAK